MRFSDCLQHGGPFEYLTIIYSPAEDGYQARILAEWETKLGELEKIMHAHGLQVMVCAVDVVED